MKAPWWPRLALAGIVVGCFAFFAAHQTTGVRSDDSDWAMYVMHARNILEGRPYTETGYRYQPESTTEVGANSYPSGLPLLMAPVVAVAGISVRAFKLLNAGLLALSLWPTFLLLRRAASPGGALLGTLALAFSSLVLLTYNGIGSDAPFQLASLLILVLVLHVVDEGLDRSAPWRWGIVTGLAIAFSYLIRPFGLALLLGVGGADLWRHRRITPFALAVGGSFLPLAAFNALLLHSDTAYASQFTFAPRAVASHVVSYVGYLSYLFANPLSHLLRYALWVLMLPLLAYGVVVRLRARGITVVEVYTVVLAAVLAVYWVPNARYLLPLMPVVLLYLLAGARELLPRLGDRRRAATVVAAAALLVAPLANALLVRPNPRDSLVGTPAFEALSAQLEARTPADTYVVFWNPRVLSLWSERQASGWPLDASPPDLRDWLRRIDADYLVIDLSRDEDRRTLAPLTGAAGGAATVWFENERFRVLALHPAPAAVVP